MKVIMVAFKELKTSVTEIVEVHTNKVNKKIAKKLILFVVLVALLLPAHASALSLFDWSENVGEIFVRINSVFISVLGKLLGWSVQLFTGIIQWQDFEDVAVVKTSWTIVRDFVNMFFILILVIVSFGTILGLERYSITTPGLLSKIIIAALLINFSLAIGGMIIDVSQVFSGVFLNSLGDFAGNLGSGLNLNKIFSTEEADQFGALAKGNLSPDKFIAKSVIDSFFTLIIIGILLLSMLAAAIFSFIRIPILWGLLIISPAAWLLGILPFSQGLSKKWWDYFIGWTFFLPSYLFMMVIGTAILKNRNQIDPLFDHFKTSSSVASLGNYAIQDIFFYIVAIMILTGSLAASLKVGKFASVGASGAFNKVKGGVENYTRVGAFRAGLKSVGGQIVEQGLPGRLRKIYGGAQARRQREAAWAEKFGRVLGYAPEFRAQKEFVSSANKEYENVQQLYNLGKLRIEDVEQKTGQYSATDPRGFAYRKMLAKLGRLDEPRLSEVLHSLKNNPFAAQDFAKTARESKFSNVRGGVLREMAAGTGTYASFRDNANYLPARREIYRHIQFDPKIASGLSAVEFERGAEIFGGPTTTEGKSYLEEVGRVRPDLVANYRHSPSQVPLLQPLPNGAMPTRLDTMRGMLTDEKNIAFMSLDLWGTVNPAGNIVGGDADFRTALSAKLNNPAISARTRDRFRSRLESLLINAPFGNEKLEVLRRL